MTTSGYFWHDWDEATTSTVTTDDYTYEGSHKILADGRASEGKFNVQHDVVNTHEQSARYDSGVVETYENVDFYNLEDDYGAPINGQARLRMTTTVERHVTENGTYQDVLGAASQPKREQSATYTITESEEVDRPAADNYRTTWYAPALDEEEEYDPSETGTVRTTPFASGKKTKTTAGSYGPAGGTEKVSYESSYQETYETRERMPGYAATHLVTRETTPTADGSQLVARRTWEAHVTHVAEEEVYYILGWPGGPALVPWGEEFHDTIDLDSPQAVAARQPKEYTIPWADPPDGVTAFFSGLGTGAKVGSNALTDTVFGFLGVGGLLFDNPLHADPTEQDLANGYNGAYSARVGTEFIAGVLTGGAASVLGRGGQAAKLAGYGVVGLDVGGNVVSAGQGAVNAYQQGGLNWQNSTQMIGGALGLGGNALGALGKSADDVADAGAATKKTGQFGGPTTGKPQFIEGWPDPNRTRAHTILQQAAAEEALETGAYNRVGMNRPLSEFSGLKHSPNIRPDVIGLRHDGRIDMIEIRSPGQTMQELKQKLHDAMGQLPPGMRGGIGVFDPGDAL